MLVSDKGLQDFKEIVIPKKFLSKVKAFQYRTTKSRFIYPKSLGNGFYFSDVVSPYFLEYGGDTLQKAYHMRCSAKELDYTDIDNGADKFLYTKASRENLFYYSNDLMDAGDFIFLPIVEGTTVRTAIYNKKTGKNIYVNEIVDDLIRFATGNAFAGSSQSGFYVKVLL